MKRTILVAVFATVCLIIGKCASAQVSHGHLQTIQFSPSYIQRGSCNVNGVLYPVGQDYRVWGYDANSNPWVIGWVDWPRPNYIWRFHGANGTAFDVQCQ